MSNLKNFIQPPRERERERESKLNLPQKLLFFINSLIIIIIVVIITVITVKAWTSPNNNPPISTNQALYMNNGNVGIGTSTPSQKLTVAGTIESTSGGFKFPDGSSQLNVIGLRDSYRNLVIKNNIINPNFQMDITVDEVILQDTIGNPFRIASLSTTVSIASSGANGLDTGTEAASTWYHIWVIAKSDGTKAGLLSTSSSAPTMPSMYIFKAYVGSIYNDSASNFISISQINNKVVTLQREVIIAGTATVITALDLTAVVPVTTKIIKGNATGNIQNTLLETYLYSNSSGLGIQIVKQAPLVSNYSSAMYQLKLVAPQTMYYIIANGAPANIYVQEWEY